MVKRKDLQYLPVELSRGATYDNCTFVLDEAQNFSWLELLTIISRIGENSKMIVLGDLQQIDTDDYYDETGLWKLVNSKAFKESSLTSYVQLETQYRSKITKLITEVDNELREKRHE